MREVEERDRIEGLTEREAHEEGERAQRENLAAGMTPLNNQLMRLVSCHALIGPECSRSQLKGQIS